MEIRKIEDLIYDWQAFTNDVIRFENIDFKKLQKLFRETYNVLEEFSKEKLVPKQISKLLIEMNDFGWWVSDLDDTPLHEFYQELLSLITGLNKYFLTRDYDVETLKRTIDNITEYTFKSVEIIYE